MTRIGAAGWNGSRSWLAVRVADIRKPDGRRRAVANRFPFDVLRARNMPACSRTCRPSAGGLAGRHGGAAPVRCQRQTSPGLGTSFMSAVTNVAGPNRQGDCCAVWRVSLLLGSNFPSKNCGTGYGELYRTFRKVIAHLGETSRPQSCTTPRRGFIGSRKLDDHLPECGSATAWS